MGAELNRFVKLPHIKYATTNVISHKHSESEFAQADNPAHQA
jgi:hypothetical protein